MMTTFKLGRKRPPPRLIRHLSTYIPVDLPPPPAISQYMPNSTYSAMQNAYDNDTLSDCTAAGAGHIIALWRGNASNNEPAPKTEDVVDFYSKTTGYVRGDPLTDEGGDEIAVLNYWKNQGFFSDGSAKILGYVNVNGANQLRIKQAFWLFENLYFGIEMPNAWIRPFPHISGFVWDVAGNANPNNGHCFVAVGYNSLGVQIDSWGLFGTITWAAIAKYATTSCAGELHVVLSEEVVNHASLKAPNGFGLDELRSSLLLIDD